MASRRSAARYYIHDRQFAKTSWKQAGRTSSRLARRSARTPRPERTTQSNSQGPLRTLNRPTRSMAECLLLAMNGHLSDLRSDTFAIALSQQFAAAGRRLRCRHKQIVMLFHVRFTTIFTKVYPTSLGVAPDWRYQRPVATKQELACRRPLRQSEQTRTVSAWVVSRGWWKLAEAA